MHKIYEKVWKWANQISNKFPFSNKSWFLLINVCIWTLIGLAATYAIMMVVDIAKSSLDKLVWEFVGTGYIAIIIGFGGGIMYLLRNTNPEDIK